MELLCRLVAVEPDDVALSFLAQALSSPKILVDQALSYV